MLSAVACCCVMLSDGSSCRLKSALGSRLVLVRHLRRLSRGGPCRGLFLAGGAASCCRPLMSDAWCPCQLLLSAGAVCAI